MSKINIVIAAAFAAFSAATAAESVTNDQWKYQFSLPPTLTAAPVRAADADRGWIQRAIDRTAAAGGGRVTIPAGEHVTGTIRMRSHVELYLAKGAVLKASTKQEDYDEVPVSVCSVAPEFSRRALIIGWDAEDVSITGEGTVDGNGPKFYDTTKFVRNSRLRNFWQIGSMPRPRLVQFVRCRNVRITGVTFKDAAAFTMYMRLCEDVAIGHISIVGDKHITNNDGLDFDACRKVRVGDSTFDTGDDCFAFRAIRERGRAEHVVCEDVVVSNCTLASACQAIRIGCPSDDMLRNILFKDIRMNGNNGIYFGNHAYCVRESDQGYVDVTDVRFERFTGEMTGSAVQILVDDGIRPRRISNVVCRDFDVRCVKPLRFKAPAVAPIGDVLLENFKAAVEKDDPCLAIGVNGLKFRNVTLNGTRRADGSVTSQPGSAAPFKRKPSICWDTQRW